MSLAGLFDRGSLLHALAGLAMAMAGFPWWIVLIIAILAQVGLAAARGMMSKTELPWPDRNHVAMDLGLTLVGFLAGWWLDPFHLAR